MVKDAEQQLEMKLDAVVSDYKENAVKVKRLEALQDVWEQRSADAKMRLAQARSEFTDKIREKTIPMDLKIE